MTDTPSCHARVYRGGFYSDGRCSRKGVVKERGDFWCRQHVPSVVAAKWVKKAEKDKAARATEKLLWKIDKAKKEIAEVAIDMYERHALKNTDEIEEAIEKYKELRAQLDG